MPTDRVLAVLPAAERMLAEGASYNEVARTLGISHSTLRYHLPGRSQWTVRDGGFFAAACREARRAVGLRVWDPSRAGGV